MTLRETYAGMFMQGLLERSGGITQELLDDALYKVQTKLAVLMADALIEELEKKKPIN